MKQLNCLVDNIYHEARGEPKAGMIAVARVTLNRVGRWEDTICKVVHQKNQFSWTKKKIKKSKQCPECVDAALTAFAKDGFEATHYHNQTVNPKWGLTKVASIGNHTFYQ